MPESKRPKSLERKREAETLPRLPVEQKQSVESGQQLFPENYHEEPYYTLRTERAWELKRIADLLSEIEDFREEFAIDVAPKRVKDSLVRALEERIQIEQKILEHPGNPLLVDLVIMILRRDANKLNRLAKAFAAAQPDQFRRRPLAEAASIWTIVACDKLYEQGRRAGSVKWKEIKETALQLQAEYQCRMAGGKFEKERVAFMPAGEPNFATAATRKRSLKWERISRSLEINVKGAKPGRPKKKQAEERAKKFNKARLRIFTPSK